MIKYTEEQKKFLQEFIPDHTHPEIVEEFNKRWPIGWTINQSYAYVKNHKMNSKYSGRFKKGEVSRCKGRKFPGRKNSGQFKKGNKPKSTWKPVGTIMTRKNGYKVIKIDEPNKWIPYGQYIWEQAHGTLKENEQIIYLDGNENNCSIDNLMAVSKGVVVTLNRKNWRTDNSEVTKAYANITVLQQMMKGKQNGKN